MLRTLSVCLASMLVAVGCAGKTGSSELTVFAAASLQKAFDRYAGQFTPGARLSFAGSDALATQIEHGLRPDVFASADTALPERLYRKGLVERPEVFAANRLVLAVPASSRSIRDLADAARPGRAVAIGQASVPVGAYARVALDRLPSSERRALIANVKDSEPDVSGIVGKLTEGAVDAGFVYATDVAATDGRLRAIELPAALRPKVAYAIAVVSGTSHAALARRFVAGVLSGVGRRALLAAGFSAPEGR